jgi:hypothetical protein
MTACLKRRSDDEARPVPIPSDLVAIFRWHLTEFGIALVERDYLHRVKRNLLLDEGFTFPAVQC